VNWHLAPTSAKAANQVRITIAHAFENAAKIVLGKGLGGSWRQTCGI
jgi:hypothetical protein